MKAYVLFYTMKTMVDNALMDVDHYKYFLYKKDLESFLVKQNSMFTPIAIQKLNVSKSTIVDSKFKIIKNFMQEGKR